jgi:hypothetical protein
MRLPFIFEQIVLLQTFLMYFQMLSPCLIIQAMVMLEPSVPFKIQL